MTLPEVIQLFKSPAFIATVLDTGDILQVALDAGYAHVVGCTTSKEDATYCQERFKGTPVKIFHGEDIILHEVIKDVNVSCTFCLDARSEPAPALIQELGVLKHHRIKSHNIIVRNTSLFGKPESGMISEYQVMMAIRQINGGYRFRDFGDALVATYP